MRFTIAAVGRLKDGPDRTLIERYANLLSGLGRSCGLGPLQIVELPESRASTAALRGTDEAGRLLSASASADRRILLDEDGRSYSSERFAEMIGRHRDDGIREMAFLIGGADGHGEQAKRVIADSLSLSPFTLPHGLARIVLAEQLYRAVTILSGHPYHRS
ncbi:MAG: 23S rRNA (pseudouridine(1915)-N(3))-methyltransferase RlmH [Alphaproteobacteria bacterium]|nr:23S rRNA (pseudouridine(1915)-N(3))-methyltransferase RlmH [Alphaproteobacteria bacterium]